MAVYAHKIVINVPFLTIYAYHFLQNSILIVFAQGWKDYISGVKCVLTVYNCTITVQYDTSVNGAVVWTHTVQ